MAAAMGAPYMPWQRATADVALEVLPDGSWAYGVVIVHVQRQAGKTTLFGPVSQHRCLTIPDGQVWVTAQTGGDARDIWMDVAKRVRRSVLAPIAVGRYANGSESVTWHNGATFRPFPPAEDSLHGKATHLVGVDEGWAFSDVAGTALEAAITPTFTTTGGQLWIISAGGTASSEWLLRHVLAGRLAVEVGLTEGVCYVEFGIDEADAPEVAAGLDPAAGDPAFAAALDVILAAHPANGHTLRRGALVTAARSMKPNEFLRAYGNHWTRAGERVIPATLWDAGRRDPTSAASWPPPSVPVGLGFAASVDHRDAAVVAAWRDVPGGPLRLDVVAARPGTDWLAGAVLDARDRWRPAAVGHDKAGPALDVADELARSGVDDLVPTTTSDYAAACSALLRAIVAGRCEHPGQADLDLAVGAAARRNIGDGLWAWSRRGSASTIAALEAATVAAWAFDHAPAAKSAPIVVAARPRSAPTSTRRRRPMTTQSERRRNTA